MQGRLIVFEGIDGSGKTTQLERIYQWLQSNPWPQGGHQVYKTHEPGATQMGQHLRRILLEGRQDSEPLDDRSELLLYAADRVQHVETCLKPWLAQGACILCDRYVESTVAYQGYGRQLNREWIDWLNQYATGGLLSDLTLWLDVDVPTALGRTRGRGAIDRMEQADLEFYHRVHQGFRDLWHAHPDRMVRIDASGDESAITLRIQQVLRDRFQF